MQASFSSDNSTFTIRSTSLNELAKLMLLYMLCGTNLDSTETVCRVGSTLGSGCTVMQCWKVPVITKSKIEFAQYLGLWTNTCSTKDSPLLCTAKDMAALQHMLRTKLKMIITTHSASPSTEHQWYQLCWTSYSGSVLFFQQNHVCVWLFNC